MDSISKSKIGKSILMAICNVEEDKGNKLYHSKSDIILAIYLAALTTYMKKNGNNMEGTNIVYTDSVFYSPYLTTLPGASSYDNIPRRWSDKELNRYLGGTSLLPKVRKDKMGVLEDYATVAKILKCNENDLIPIPTLELFDSCLAAVSSRAFAEFGGTDIIQINSKKGDENVFYCSKDAMVPMLDLLDHKRGSQQTPEVRYECVGGDIIVKARQNIAKNTVIRDTYGAKGNAQLLRRYGFCLPDNLEPDGSSNDILELDISQLLSSVLPDSPVSSLNRNLKSSTESPVRSVLMNLRAGPKAYTYGGFVKVVEMCLNHEKDTSASGSIAPSQVKDDDLDAFLNECEEEGHDFGEDESDDDIDGFDGFYLESNERKDTDETYFASNNESCGLTVDQAEFEALNNLRLALKYALSNYALSEDSMKFPSNEQEKNASFLVISEKRTISLYLYAIDIIQDDMQKANKKTGKNNICYKESNKGNQASIDTIFYKSTEDRKMIHSQAEELRKVYLQIRHPEILSVLNVR